LDYFLSDAAEERVEILIAKSTETKKGANLSLPFLSAFNFGLQCRQASIKTFRYYALLAFNTICLFSDAETAALP